MVKDHVNGKGSLDLTQKHSCLRSLVSTLMLLQRIYCNLICQQPVKSFFTLNPISLAEWHQNLVPVHLVIAQKN